VATGTGISNSTRLKLIYVTHTHENQFIPHREYCVLSLERPVGTGKQETIITYIDTVQGTYIHTSD